MLSVCGKDHVLGVCKLSKSFILPELLAISAEPIFNMTVGYTGGFYGLNVNNIFGACSGNNNVLEI